MALLNTVMTEACILNSQGKMSSVFSALIVIPTNTATNWDNEMNKWCRHLDKSLNFINLRAVAGGFQSSTVQKWKLQGGILIVTDPLVLKHRTTLLSSHDGQPDVLIIDEAHIYLKNSSTQISRILHQIKTRRRILLTGTPFQNNTTEFFHLVNFVRPGVIPGIKSDAEFDMKYR
jgi:SNF2 family DNA or RNA helicase